MKAQQGGPGYPPQGVGSPDPLRSVNTFQNMNAIIYIAFAIPLVGFLMRHLVITRDNFNEALKGKNNLHSIASGFILNGLMYLIISILVSRYSIKSLSDDWPSIIVMLIFLTDAIWDFGHGVKLIIINKRSSIHAEPTGNNLKNETSSNSSKDMPYELRIQNYDDDTLLDVKRRINREEYPERYDMILREIDNRKTEQSVPGYPPQGVGSPEP